MKEHLSASPGPENRTTPSRHPSDLKSAPASRDSVTAAALLGALVAIGAGVWWMVSSAKPDPVQSAKPTSELEVSRVANERARERRELLRLKARELTRSGPLDGMEARRRSLASGGASTEPQAPVPASAPARADSPAPPTLDPERLHEQVRWLEHARSSLEASGSHPLEAARRFRVELPEADQKAEPPR